MNEPDKFQIQFQFTLKDEEHDEEDDDNGSDGNQRRWPQTIGP